MKKCISLEKSLMQHECVCMVFLCVHTNPHPKPTGLKSARLFVLSSCKTLLLMSGEIRVQSWITDGGLVQMWQKQTVSHSPVQVGRKRPEEAKSGLGLQIYYSISAKTKERKGRGQMETS